MRGLQELRRADLSILCDTDSRWDSRSVALNCNRVLSTDGLTRCSGAVSLAMAGILLTACAGTSTTAAVRSPSPSAVVSATAQGVATPGLGSCPTAIPASSTTSSSPVTPPSPLSTPNLINNPGADADTGAPSNNEVVNPSGWSVQAGQPTAIQYGATGGFPGASDPGPPDRRANFFSGGNAACSELIQAIDLSSRATDIDARKLTFVLSGWLGGFSTQDDFAIVMVSFAPAPSGNSTFQIGPILPSERQGQTGLFYRAASSNVPAGARTATILIQMTRFEGTYDDGSADSLGLQLSPVS
jgi:hypothetical protein